MSQSCAVQVEEALKRPSNVVQNICRMLQRECRRYDVFVEDKFLPFYVYLTPFQAVGDGGLAAEKPEDIYRLMKQFVQNRRIALATQKTVSLNTLLLQYFHLRACFDLDVIFQRNAKEIQKKSKSALKQVLKTNPRTLEARERLLKKITCLVAIDNGFGEENLSETEAAIKSVLSPGDLSAFSMLKKKDKVEVLEDLKVIVCGIRLFSNDAGHEANKLIDLADLLENTFDNTRLLLEYEQEMSCQQVKSVTEKIHASRVLNSGGSDLDANQLSYLREISLFVHQRYNMISSILKSLLDQKADIFDTINGYRKTLKEMHAILVYKTAINTRDVYPKFKYLGFIWKKLQQFVYLLSEMNLFLDKVHSLHSVWDYLEDVIDKTQNETVENSINRSKSTSPTTKVQKKGAVETPTTCEYHNYCAWALSLGFILPMGDGPRNILEFKQRRYIFHSSDALKQFKAHPEQSLLDIVRVLYERPEIMLFLERDEELRHLLRIQNEHMRMTFYGCRDVNCQTERETEGSTSNSLTPNAVQEIQLLRKRALQLANRANYANNTSQTDIHYNVRYCTGTQTKSYTTRSIQTGTEVGVQTV